MEKLGEQASRLVLVLYPFQGHINPMLQLATIFHSKGYSITIVHPEFNSPNPSNHPQFTFISIPDRLLESKVSLSPGDFMSLVLALNKNCAAPLKQCLKRILDEMHPYERIAGIVYDALMYFAQTVADDLGLPGISMRPTAAAMLLFAVIPHPDQESVFENQLPELQPLQLKQMVAAMSENPTDAMSEVRAAALNATKRSSAMIANTMDFLEEAALSKIKEYSPAPIFTIGPFHKLAPSNSSSLLKEDAYCISWLDKQAPKSVIYVSFGSMASLSKQDIVEIAWGLANSEQPFLWVIRPGLVLGSEGTELLPESFQEKVGERGCIVKWAPQREVLAHDAVGGFWTHCGWNSTLESVSEGVAMLCKPCFGDQFLNMRYICYVWKIGLELDNELERGKIEGAIKRLMVDIEGVEIRNKAMDLKKKAEICLREGGTSYSSSNEFTKRIL
ncbi:PREDICTED: UDP-glucose iridoid glucosyltransferase [Theobroma cacao]|uniref:UDP-glucose iridoid glucosyltransferase n=2 Tax=Theobroma cacao TaxID=3641 RepID=A0AB32WXT2_THECC|nr:PREDICTED: UDP-glucose iridoid glucosyltransferase [Theobroma cacao]EOY33885.1 UGT protein isoform 1 [Theobroma cacao]